MEMLVAKYFIVSFVPMTSNSFSEVYVTNRATAIATAVSGEQLDKAFASRNVLVPVVFVVVFKAEAILDFTLVTISVAWYRPYKTSFIELELVLHVAM